jgi:hypothetical protein
VIVTVMVVVILVLKMIPMPIATDMKRHVHASIPERYDATDTYTPQYQSVTTQLTHTRLNIRALRRN